MERFTVTATATSFNGNLSQRPIFEGNEASLSYTTFPTKPHLRDASFSSYLRSDEELAKSVAQERITCRVVKDSTEISIFQAERYFNESQDQKENKKENLDRIVERCDLPTIPRLSSVSSVDGYGRNYRTGSFHATPTASSEASWNSQSGLLSNPPGSIAVSMRNLPLDVKKKGSSSSSTKWFFGRKCPCSGKKSVQVDDKFSETKTPVHLICNSNGSLNPKKQNSKAGEVNLDIAAAGAPKERAKEFEKNLGIDERAKVKIVSGNWTKEQEIVRNSGRFSPENHFPAEVGSRVLPSGMSFTDGGGFSFPILNPSATGKLVLNGAKAAVSQFEDPPRESLEVFRPSEEESVTRKSTEIQHRMLMSFPGDNDRRSFTFPASPKTRGTAVTDDDVASDASSDLFEIESFSTQTTLYPMYRRRDSLEEISSYDARRFDGNGAGILNFRRSLDETTTPSIAPTECYEPSEASIDWSVTTAEGFDRGSTTNFSIAASDYEEMRFMRHESEKVPNNGSITSSKRRGNGLLSCRCEKAVNVGPHPIKFVPEQCRVGPTFPAESGRIPAMSKLGNISSMHGTRGSAGRPPLARSNSARMSHVLATH